MRRMVLALVVVLGIVSAPLAAAAQQACITSVGGSGEAPDNLSVGTCFGAGAEVSTPRGVEVTLTTPGGGEITVRGNSRLKLEGLTSKGESFWLRQGRAALNVVARSLDFFKIRGEGNGKEFSARVRGTEFEMEVGERGIRLDPIEGEIRVAKAVRLRLEETPRPAGQRDTGGRDQARYFEETVVVSGGSEDILYSLEEDEYLDIETYEECVDHFTRQLEQDLSRYPDGVDPDISEGYVNLGDCHLVADKAAPAIEAFERALDIDRELFGDMDADVAEDYRGLGEAHLINGDPGTAVEYFERALAIDLELFGEDDFDVVSDLYLLSDAWAEAGDLPRADEFEARAQAIENRLEGN